MNVPHEHLATGSPLYDVSPEHGAAVVALGALLLGMWLARRGKPSALAPMDTLLVFLLGASSAVHFGLVFGHGDEGGGIALLFIADAALLAVVARRVARGERAGRLGVGVLIGSIFAYWLALLGGEAPDQVGLSTKLAELLALAIVLRPAVGQRAAWTSSAIALLVVGTAVTSWVGAFRASAAEPGAVAGHHVHGGHVPPPGVILPVVPDRDPTPAERAAANALVAAARVALAKYTDPAVAAADGYHVQGLAGIDFHATNPAFEHDDRVLDPARPESLVYAVAPNGRAVLLGAMFQMPKIGVPGPTIGGPLTMWHAHEHVCISVTPPFLTGLLGPLGMCPVGSVDVPLTPEMIHIWIVPGAPQPFGDLDEAWKRAYLRAIAQRS